MKVLKQASPSTDKTQGIAHQQHQQWLHRLEGAELEDVNTYIHWQRQHSDLIRWYCCKHIASSSNLLQKDWIDVQEKCCTAVSATYLWRPAQFLNCISLPLPDVKLSSGCCLTHRFPRVRTLGCPTDWLSDWQPGVHMRGSPSSTPNGHTVSECLRVISSVSCRSRGD